LSVIFNIENFRGTHTLAVSTECMHHLCFGKLHGILEIRASSYRAELTPALISSPIEILFLVLPTCGPSRSGLWPPSHAGALHGSIQVRLRYESQESTPRQG
jgi:hypothetical protein